MVRDYLGVSEMGVSRVFPRAAGILRSVMVAGAGTVFWLTLSATAASADDGAVNTTPTTVNSTVSLSVPVPKTSLPAPIAALAPTSPVKIPLPAVTPVVQEAGHAVDGIIGALPVVNAALPVGTTGQVVEATVVPVTEEADELIEVVVPPINQATAPILQPVVDAVDTVIVPAAPVVLPAEPALPTAPQPTVPGDGGVQLIPDIAVVPPVSTAGRENPDGNDVDSGIASASGQLLLSAGTSLKIDNPSISNAVSANQDTPVIGRILDFREIKIPQAEHTASNTENPMEFPADLEAVPAAATGAGSGNSHNGPPSSAAAILNGALVFPNNSLSGLAAAENEQRPKPVSFDPGSSPD